MTTYEKWTVAISAVSAIVTLIAVLVALWQTKYANAKKLKLTNTNVAILVQNTLTGAVTNSKHLYLSVKAVNVGNRKIILNDWGIHISKSFGFQIVNATEKIFPCEIDAEQYKEFRCALIELRDALKKNEKEIGRTDKKLRIYVADSTGKRYYTKLPHSVEYYMNLTDARCLI